MRKQLDSRVTIVMIGKNLFSLKEAFFNATDFLDYVSCLSLL